MKIFQKGFNYSQDGEGNRLVYHLQGCNMHCPWCANPEGLDPMGVIIADEEWMLPGICPHGAIVGKEVKRSICRQCEGRECISMHDTKAMQLSYFEMTPQELVLEAQNNEMMFYDGGGVTFTGGEASLQFEELKEALMGLKKAGISTCMETNGSHRRLPELFPYLDQLIMDCKLIDADKHKKYTGIEAEPVLENIRLAAKIHPKLHVRVPLIGGVNTSEEDLERFCQFFDEIKGAQVTFEALLYHEYGKQKWKQCGYPYQMTKEAYVDSDLRRALIERLRSLGARYQST